MANGRKDDRRSPTDFKVCKDCGKKKPVDQFYLTSYARKNGTHSRMPYCIPCYSKRGKAYYAVHGDRINKRVAMQTRERKRNDPKGFQLVRADVYLRHQYGISLDQLKKRLAKQDHKCSICQRKLKISGVGKHENFAVDHDHACCSGARSCGRCIRALLCTNCNWGLGQFGDNPRRLRKAARYLEGWAAARTEEAPKQVSSART